MKHTQFALFMVLNGRATEALTFYQEAFAGDILFKITNQEFKERLNPSLTIPAGEEHWLSHSILQMDTFQLQLADNPLFAGMNTTPTEQLTLSLTVESRHSAKTIFEKLTCHPESCIIQEPIENEFATFYAIVKDPFGLVTQITQEKQADPTKKGR
ncbi:VOC family protein [Enterococcus faecalis]|uniref:VOC family protein n=1 Tax=Enterococcus faecalis TaxID=1351 RepID=UPI0033900BF2